MYLHSELSIIYYVKLEEKGVSIMKTMQSIKMLTQLHHHT